MAVRAGLELNLVERFLALRNMALRAFEAGMAAFQRVRAFRVFLHRKFGWLEAFDRMTSRALALIGALGELAAVRIRFVTGNALVEHQRLLEIAARMTLYAFHLRMLPLQGILRLRVIEVLGESGSDLLPTRSCVAGLASLLEAAMVNIVVAVRTLSEGKASVARLSIGSGGMALLALHLQVLSGQGVACLGVIKLLDRCDGFPVGEIVALLAIRAQSSLVRILVASGAVLRNAEKGLAEILNLD